MNLRVNHNLAASIALRGLSASTKAFGSASERLATGLRINRASDGPLFAGVEQLRVQLSGVGAAITNTLMARDTLDLAQDGMSQIYDRLVRARSVALRAMGGDIGSTDNSLLQDEMDDLLTAIDRIANTTELGGNKVLNGTGDFFIEQTDKAFDDVRVTRMTYNAGETERTFDIDVVRAAERATIVTNLDASSTTPLTQGGQGIISIGGERGSTQVSIASTTTASDVIAQINGAAMATGVYASTFIANAAESAVQTFNIDADLELIGGNTFSMDVTVGGSSRTLTVTATGDADADGNVEATADDFARALTTANLGHFSVVSGVTGGNRNIIFRHSGASDFTIDNFANGTGALQGLLAAGGPSITGTQPTDARIISDGLGFDATTRTAQIEIQAFFAEGGGNLFQRSILGTTANYNNGADLAAALDDIATVTYLGVNDNGQDIFLFTANADVEAFRFLESSAGGTDARNMGLLSHSGGGNGLASQGMGVVALYSEEFGSDHTISMRNAGDVQLNLNVLNESSSANAGMAPGGGDVTGRGVDVVAEIEGRRINGHGFHLSYASSRAEFDIDFAPRLGPGSITNAINKALTLNYANPSAQSMLGFRSLSNHYESQTSFDLTRPNDAVKDPLSAAYQGEGIIDRVSFTVNKTAPGGRARSGLAAQLTDQASGREFIGIRSFDISHLGGLPSSEAQNGSMAHRLDTGMATLSQIRRGGLFHIEGDTERISNAIAIIDRAIDQTLKTQAQVGLYQTVTLDGTRDFLVGLQENISQTRQDLAGTDVAKEATALAAAQILVQANVALAAQANALPQTLLTLLR